ncbi:MAG: tetratricopeptide repeat protein [Pyrinomonadaceae bacterium]
MIVCFALSVVLSQHIEATKPPLPENYGDSDLEMNGSYLRGYALGTESLIADWYYMRSLQYVGDKLVNSKSDFINIEDLRDLNPRLLYPYLDNATDLDPHFIEAYTYGAIVLPAVDQQQAIKLTQKGIANNPNQWRLYQYLGYIYWHSGNYEKAAEYYQKGSEIAGAAPFMKLMAGMMRVSGGSRETAREIFQQMLRDNGQDPMVVTTADLRLMELDWLDQRDAMNDALARYNASNGRCPGDLREIAPAIRMVTLPAGNEFHINDSAQLIDPSGAPYLLDHDKCEIKLDLSKTAIAH